MRLLVLLAVLLSIPLCAFGQDEMLIGLVPTENIFRQMERYRPLAAYLSQKVGIKVKLTILSRYGDVIDRFATRNMDGAFFGGLTSVIAMDKLSVEPIARPVYPDGSSTVQSYIFVRSDSNIKTVSDMKGKRMAFVDRAAVSGYLFAFSYLRGKGIKDIEHFFREYFFTGSNDSAIYAVLDNRADIGTAESRVYASLVEREPSIKNELTIVARSVPYPSGVLCLKKDMPAMLRERFKEILLAMDRDTEGAEVLKKMELSRFAVTTNDDFKAITEIVKKAGVDIKRYQYK